MKSYPSELKKIFAKFRKQKLEVESINSYKPKIAFFTGAGVSKESGLDTFRDNGGLWNNFSVAEVATASAIKNNFPKVNDFYNERRREILKAVPNAAHLTIKELEDLYEVVIITQNVDDLHERAGCSNIIHLHGEILKSRSLASNRLLYDQYEDIKVGDRCPISNAQLRPHIILFNERLNETDYYAARRQIRESDILVVIGTSLKVEPAASLITEAIGQKEFYIIDPNGIELKYKSNFVHIHKTATEGISELKNILIQRHSELVAAFNLDKDNLLDNS